MCLQCLSDIDYSFTVYILLKKERRKHVLKKKNLKNQVLQLRLITKNCVVPVYGIALNLVSSESFAG